MLLCHCGRSGSPAVHDYDFNLLYFKYSKKQKSLGLKKLHMKHVQDYLILKEYLDGEKTSKSMTGGQREIHLDKINKSRPPHV